MVSLYHHLLLRKHQGKNVKILNTIYTKNVTKRIAWEATYMKHPAEEKQLSGKVITVAIVIGVIAAFVMLMALRILPVPTPVQIISWLISLSVIFFLAIIGGVFVGMYIYHIFSYAEELDPWEEAVLRTEKNVQILVEKVEELEKKMAEIESKIKEISDRT